MKTQKDSLGDRIKGNYENRTRNLLPRRTNTIIRLDGKAFHSYTKGCKRPFDFDLMEAMDETAKYLCENIQGAKLAYIQSDEISVLLTDYDNTCTDAWFDGNIQKIASISASMATAKFNDIRNQDHWMKEGGILSFAYQSCIDFGKPLPERELPSLAIFDSRVFTIPDNVEVHNYFVWRQNDSTRNSIQMVAQANFSHKELQNINCNQIQEKLWQEKNINWNDFPVECKRGRTVIKYNYNVGETVRSGWKVDKDIPVFTQDMNYILGLLPKFPANSGDII